MEIPFESQAKDKKLVFVMSKELLEECTKASEKKGIKRMAWMRIALINSVDLHKGKKFKRIKSKYEPLKQDAKVSLVLPLSLFNVVSDTAEALKMGLYEFMREGIERALG